MWCHCAEIKPTSIGCLNIPYSSIETERFTITEILVKGIPIDFTNIDVEDAFMIIKKIDNNNALVFEELSITNGYIEIGDDGLSLHIKMSDKLKEYNKKLFYQFFVKENGVNFPMFKGELCNLNFYK